MTGDNPASRSRKSFGAVAPWASLRKELDDVFDNFGLTSFRGFGGENGLSMNVDYSETDKDILISAEVPGVKAEDIDVSLHGDRLTIKAEKKSERDEEKENYHISERSYGSYARTFTVPEGVDPEAVKADIKDGVLKLTIPKPAEAQTRAQKIKVKPSEGA